MRCQQKGRPKSALVHHTLRTARRRPRGTFSLARKRGAASAVMKSRGQADQRLYSGRMLSGSQSVYTRRFGPAWSMPSIACRVAGTSNRSFGVISNARHKSEIRVDATAFVPRSYFWICWKLTPRASPSSVWFSPSFKRRIRITEPIFLSISQSRLRTTVCLPVNEKPPGQRARLNPLPRLAPCRFSD